MRYLQKKVPTWDIIPRGKKKKGFLNKEEGTKNDVGSISDKVPLQTWKEQKMTLVSILR